MPIPLAHPAAVLPLRRYSRWFNFPALVIGSIVPDVGYLSDDETWSTLSHQFLGSIAFGFPITILALILLYGFRSMAVGMLPESQKRIFLPLCERPIGPLWIVAVSALIGIWSHVLWDSATHVDGWIVQRIPILQLPVIQMDDRTARVCHLIWYGSSFAGVGWLYLEFQKWKQESGKTIVRDAILLSILIVPISLIHHLITGVVGMILTAVFCVLLALPFVLKAARSRGQPV